MSLSPQTKQKISVVLNVSKTVFHWGFIPAVLYLAYFGNKKFDSNLTMKKIEGFPARLQTP
ncbi:hypothetical protein TSAR_014391 [Trichomalopsis sarcophagae]|uniref:Uncharacterized protein n=1 Tax=Trichomalopsis sarcophagae TaxID=543379 RepID=A0A232EQL2_9HYME|nr:hypothetical protein TSAR_014391 [Trichomalopsis sarcophagae]